MGIFLAIPLVNISSYAPVTMVFIEVFCLSYGVSTKADGAHETC